MKVSLLTIREEAYEALGITELPGAEHPHYDQALRIIGSVLERCLEGHSWFFARKRVRLNGEGDVFVLPDDFLSLLWCEAGSYELIGRELRCRAGGGVEILYVSRSCLDELEGNGVTEMPGYFVDCVVSKTAERLAPMVSGSQEMRVSLHQLYELALQDAKLADVRQYASNGRVVEPLDLYEGTDGFFNPFH